jgi:surfactin synthase thioesterase subunit
MVYYKWRKYLDSEIELCPIELAGRGSRLENPFYESIHDAVEDIFQIIKNDLEGDYALFGHSMGSWLALELALKLKKMGYNDPLHVFFSGNRAPHMIRNEKVLHLLPDDEFIQEIYKIGGTSEELMNNKDLLDFFIPIVKSDYKIIETYQFVNHDTYLDCDISVLNGVEDDLTDEELILI